MSFTKKNTANQCLPLTKVAQGWKPGAISKRLLRQLNKAKQQVSTEKQSKPTKKPKKRVEDKPTLIITKKDGEYRIEMQVTPDELNTEQCTPLIYRIAKENNGARIKKKECLQRRLTRKAVAEVWSDPFRPELCEKTCRKAYEQAIGLLPLDPDKPECTCSGSEIVENLDSCSCDDEDVSSDCSSSDIDWEIHFSPPITRRN